MLRSCLALSLVLLVPSLQADPPKKKNAEATASLLEAVAAGDEDVILEALAAGADPNVLDADKNPAIVLLAQQSLFGKERAIVEAMVKSRVAIDATNADGVTALMAAAATGRDGMVRLFLENGAKVDARDNDGWSPLMWAAAAGQMSAARELLKAAADFKVVDRKGWTAMGLTLANGRGSVGEMLLKAGAKIPDKAPGGLSPLLIAVFGRDLASVRQVLESGASLDGRDPDGWTALHAAAALGDGQVVMDLLRAGADESLKDKEEKTALDRAKEHEHMEIVALLGGPWEKSKRAGKGTVAVPCAALGGNVEANFAADADSLIITTTFPRPVTYYLGGGSMNRSESAKKHTYTGSFLPTYYFDIDSNVKTGAKHSDSMLDKEEIGSEYAVDYSQYGTSVTLSYRDSAGNDQTKNVYANVLSVDVEKEGEDIDTSELGDAAPRAANENGVLVSRVPLSLLELSPGKSIRVTSKVGSCAPVVATVKL